MRSRQRAALACALLCSSCREDVRELTLVFGTNKRVSDGIACPVDGVFLIQSIWGAAAPGGCMVIDLVRTNETRGCRLSELFPACTDQDCAPDLRYRVLLPLSNVGPMQMSGMMKPVPQLIDKWIEGQVHSQVVFDDAPQLLAIVRATIVRGSCDDIGDTTRFACADVVGCAFSCPIDIGTFEGEVVLDLDSLNDMSCQRDVLACAADRMFDRDEAMVQDWCDTDPQ